MASPGRSRLITPALDGLDVTYLFPGLREQMERGTTLDQLVGEMDEAGGDKGCSARATPSRATGSGSWPRATSTPTASACRTWSTLARGCGRFAWSRSELTIVLQHGGEPWVDTCLELMVKWPNVHYMSSAIAPRHIPRPIIDHANARGADRVMFASDYPLLTHERCLWRRTPPRSSSRLTQHH